MFAVNFVDARIFFSDLRLPASDIHFRQACFIAMVTVTIQYIARYQVMVAPR
ncbi:hypothetical protein [Syntrophaceticus schinkii]|uniref:hypothetical protein n=1 Tax=Syntrophaceticus schinkii TaxID=499207 RepID=UPI0012EB59F6|nr:hypothetical protein [Syntrophaceticus schinkii]